jgi:tRNA-splicing endonuclease subunit Sen2
VSEEGKRDVDASFAPSLLSFSVSAMSLIAPSGSGNRGRGGRRRGGKGGVRRNEQNNRIYAHPLPVVFSEPTPSRSLLGLLGLQRAQVLNPHCEGVFDPASRSVWVVDAAHAMILWRRGFFGKGDLSRSEPSWLARQISDRMATARGGAQSFNVIYILLMYAQR